MKTLNSYIIEGGFFKNIKAEIVTPKNKQELIKIISDTIEKEGPNCNLNFINTSKITDMSRLFETSIFDGDISEWDVSKVINMGNMFAYSEFNGDLSNWDVSKVTIMREMFNSSKLEKLNKLPDWYK